MTTDLQKIPGVGKKMEENFRAMGTTGWKTSGGGIPRSFMTDGARRKAAG